MPVYLHVKTVVKKIKTLTTEPLAVNIAVGFGPALAYSKKVVDVVIEEKVEVAIVSVGRPDVYTRELKAAGVTVMHAISTARHAKKAEEAGVDAVIIDTAHGHSLGVMEMAKKVIKDLKEKKGDEGEQHIQQAMVEVKSNLAQHLGNMDIKDDILNRLEERASQRMDEVFNKLRSEWIKTHSAIQGQEFHKDLTVLEALERGVSEDDELGDILKIIREKVASEEIDENDFAQIYPEIVKQEQLRKTENEKISF